MLDGVIRTGCDSNKVLAPDAPSLRLTLRTDRLKDPLIFWRAGLAISAAGVPLGVSFTRLLNGYALQVLHAQLLAAPMASAGCDCSSTCEFGDRVQGNLTGFMPVADGRKSSIDIIGGCDGKEIEIYKWCGGLPNEVWRFHPRPGEFPNPPASRFRFE